MDPQIIAAFITSAGSVIVAFISRHDAKSTDSYSKDSSTQSIEYHQYQEAEFDLHFLIQWVFINALGMATGRFLVSLLSSYNPLNPVWATALISSIIAITQWFILKKRLEGIGWWVPSTILGSVGASYTISSLLSPSVLSRLPFWYGFQSNVNLFSSALVGLFVGISQSIILQRYTNRSSYWVLILTLSIVLSNLIGNIFLEAGAVFVGGLTAGTLRGIMTGIFLIFLFKR
jgi:hypothetical protein